MPPFERRFVELVVFDLDGVLIDSNPAIVASFQRALERNGFAGAREDAILRRLGVPARRMLSFFAPSASQAQLDRLVEDFTAIYGEIFFPLTRLQPFVHATLRWVRAAGKKLALATNKSRAGTVRVLEAFSLAPYFDRVYAVEDVGRPKPDPEVLKRASSDLGVACERTVMVGDTENDISAAVAAGVCSVGVLTGTGTRRRLEDAGANFVIENLSQLSRVIT